MAFIERKVQAENHIICLGSTLELLREGYCIRDLHLKGKGVGVGVRATLRLSSRLTIIFGKHTLQQS